MSSQILINDEHPLMDRAGLNYLVFPSDFRQIRYFTLLLVKHSRPRGDERLLLEQQVSELVKNAVKHGNQCDSQKTVEVWYKFTAREARLIVRDQGKGFADIEKWNRFNRERLSCIDRGDWDGLMQYASWRSATSDRFDGGNAMFAALEYWNRGVVYSSARTTVAVGKTFPQDILDMEDGE